ncbi:MAG: universal stress protein [Bacteroidetes bacterium]|jgi:nucleotide-binding universal stress UspA family protein|nr:universal stress protein [Bacteroidota bacterium]
MYELRRILVPTDFSKHADEALEHAVYLGARYEPEIVLLHVDEFSVSPLGSRGMLDETVRAYQDRKAAFYEEQFARIQKDVQGRPVRLIPQVLAGRAYKVIVEESEKRDYDLIVMATRGITHLSSYLIGSTVERVVRLSRQPVLTIQCAPKHEGKVTSVLCPTDLSPAGNAALSYALSVARQNNAVLYLQYVSELEKPETLEQVLRRMPDLHQHHPMFKDVKYEVIVDRDLDPSNSIIRFAEDRDVGIIVMSTHGRKGLRRVYIGNNAAEVVRQSTRPVLTVSHPFHRRIFTHPLTEQRPVGIPPSS